MVNDEFLGEGLGWKGFERNRRRCFDVDLIEMKSREVLDGFALF